LKITDLMADMRNTYLAELMAMIEATGEECLQTGNNHFAIPKKDNDGNEFFFHITLKIPTGERNGLDYDGYFENLNYKEHLKKMEEKKAETKKKKEKAIAERQKKLDEAKKIKESKLEKMGIDNER